MTHEPAGDEVPPPSIEDQLAKLREELGAARDFQTKSTSDVAKFSAQIAALEALKKDLAKTQTDYEAAHHELESQTQALTDYLEFEMESLADELGDDGKKKVDDAAALAWSKLKDARKTVDSIEAGLKRAEAERDRKDEKRVKTLASMTAIKDLVGTIRARIKELQTRKAQIDAAHAADQFGNAYWLLTKARFAPPLEETSLGFAGKLGDDPKLVEPEELPAVLEGAVTAHNKAAAEFADAEADLTKQRERLKAAEAAVESIEKSFLDDLVTELNTVNSIPQLPIAS